MAMVTMRWATLTMLGKPWITGLNLSCRSHSMKMVFPKCARLMAGCVYPTLGWTTLPNNLQLINSLRWI